MKRRSEAREWAIIAGCVTGLLLAAQCGKRERRVDVQTSSSVQTQPQPTISGPGEPQTSPDERFQKIYKDPRVEALEKEFNSASSNTERIPIAVELVRQGVKDDKYRKFLLDQADAALKAEKKAAEEWAKTVSPSPRQTVTPLRLAPTRSVTFRQRSVAKSLTTAEVAERSRDWIEIPIDVDPQKNRLNLGLGANIRAWVIPSWSNPVFRDDQRVGPDGMFPVRVCRRRRGQVEFVAEFKVPAGPQPSYVQYPVPSSKVQMGDVLLIEWKPALMVGYSQDGRTVIFPILSVVYAGSNDPTATPGIMPGQASTILRNFPELNHGRQ